MIERSSRSNLERANSLYAQQRYAEAREIYLDIMRGSEQL